jgi:prophage tail gpP-like protein
MGPDISLQLLEQGSAVAEMRGFESVSITSSMGKLATSYQIAYSQRSSDLDVDSLVAPGDEVELRLEGEPIVAGYIDREDIKLAATGTSHSVRGRSYLGDLEDCSAFLTGRSQKLRDVALVDIVDALVSDYGIETIYLADDIEAFRTFAIRRSESVGNAVRRACALRGLWATDSGGGLVVSNQARSRAAGTLTAARIISATRSTDHQKRFSRYRFRGQSAFRDVTSIRDSGGAEIEHRDGEDLDAVTRRAQQIALEVEDPIVTRLRRLEIVAHGRRHGDLGMRALLERQQRSGASDKYTVELGGWTDDEGDLWRINTLVQVDDPTLRVNAELLIASVQLNYSTQKCRAKLTLVPPQTYETAQSLSEVTS